jgi:hypothetical protein
MKLGEDIPHADLRRGGLHGYQIVHAVGDGSHIDHGIARPGTHSVEIEDPAVDYSLQNPPIDPLVRSQR